MSNAGPKQTQGTAPEFIRRQLEFTSHIRDPQTQPAPADVEDRRMAIYRDLFYNNIEDFIANGFPVLRKIYDDTHWHAMVRDFFIRHRCKTPLFLEISQEFLNYLQSEREPQPEDPPFLLELAHYEWVELAVSIAEEEIDLTGIDPNGDLLEHIPVLSPLAWPLSYQYDVHHLGPDYQPHTPPEQATHLVVYRERDDEVGFMEINAVSARLLVLLQENPEQTGRQVLTSIAQELNHPNADVVITGGLQLMEDLRAAGILLGTRRP